MLALVAGERIGALPPEQNDEWATQRSYTTPWGTIVKLRGKREQQDRLSSAIVQIATAIVVGGPGHDLKGAFKAKATQPAGIAGNGPNRPFFMATPLFMATPPRAG